MSTNYCRELLKISLSQICDRIGFDRTSEMAMDILVDVCEREYLSLLKQLHHLIEINRDQQTIDYQDILTILFENNQDNLNKYQEYLKLFQDLHFPKETYSFPIKKTNHLYLRIPSENNEQIIQREENPSTEYIYSWLPLYPHQEKSEENHPIDLQLNLSTNDEQDSFKNLEKNESHHLLTLSSLSNPDVVDQSSSSLPIGRRANRSLPSVLYRPKRLVELDAFLAIEKSKKEFLEKENAEKEYQQIQQQQQQQSSMNASVTSTLRVTIPKSSINNDKPLLTIKKSLLTSPSSSSLSVTVPLSTAVTLATTSITTSTSTTMSGLTTISSTLNTVSSINTVETPVNKKTSHSGSTQSDFSPNKSAKKFSSSPSKQVEKSTDRSLNKVNKTNETLNNDLSSNLISINDPSKALNLSATNTSTDKVPILKLNLKNPNNQSKTNSSENSKPFSEKSSRSNKTNSSHSNKTQKVNLTLRTSSLPLLGSQIKSDSNEINPMISPPIGTDNDHQILMSINSISTKTDHVEDKSMTDSFFLTSPEKNPTKEVHPDKTKEKTKKKNSNEQMNSLKKKSRSDTEDLNNSSQQVNESKLNSSITTSIDQTANNSSNDRNSGGIRLKIKLGKPTATLDNSNQSNSIINPSCSSSDNLMNENENDNQQLQKKIHPIRLTLPLPSVGSSSSTVTATTNSQITSTLTKSNSSSNRRKSSHVKRNLPQDEEKFNEQDYQEKKQESISNIVDEDLNSSVDDLPLVVRKSPTKIASIPTQQQISPEKIHSTLIKKKSNIIKKKTTNKPMKNMVDVAVIDEKRMDYDSQEKIWICPSCNRPDNEQDPMIACDLCDDWYHWECVGIVEEPPSSNHWYCPKCHRSTSSTASTQINKSTISNKNKRKKSVN